MISRIHLSLPNAYKLMCFDKNINRNRDVEFLECDQLLVQLFGKLTLAIRASKLQNISNIPVNCCIECGLFPRSLMESTIAGAGYAGERRTLGSDDDYLGN